MRGRSSYKPQPQTKGSTKQLTHLRDSENETAAYAWHRYVGAFPAWPRQDTQHRDDACWTCQRSEFSGSSCHLKSSLQTSQKLLPWQTGHIRAVTPEQADLSLAADSLTGCLSTEWSNETFLSCYSLNIFTFKSNGLSYLKPKIPCTLKKNNSWRSHYM